MQETDRRTVTLVLGGVGWKLLDSELVSAAARAAGRRSSHPKLRVWHMSRRHNLST